MKYESLGESALTECAEALTTRGESFARHTADRSNSLDRLVARHRLGRHRALFRRPRDGGLDRARAARRTRLARRLARQPAGAAGAAARRSGIDPASLPDLAHVYRVPLPPDSDPGLVAEALRADPHVAYAQPDHAVDLDQLARPFDDPFLFSSGSWGQAFADLWGLDRIGAPEGWSRSLGEGVVVAVVDTGLDRFHPDMAANVWVNPGEDLDGDGLAEPEDANGLDDDGNGFIDDLTGFDFSASIDADGDGRYDGPEDVGDPDPFDDHGHGSHVAGTIAAVGGNGEGIVGVAPGVRVMALKGFPAEGPARTSDLWRAVLYAAEQGAAVVNNSWSCASPCPLNPLADDVLAWSEALGSVVVTSAGNASTDVVLRAPENTDRVLTVGSIGQDDVLSDFSNRGWGLDVVAPGGGPSEGPGVRVPRRNILSLLSSAIDPADEPFAVGDAYLRFSGTSMAAPHVTGAIALLRALRPDLDPAALRALVRTATRDLAAPGSDPFTGPGLLDVPTLLDAPAPRLRVDLRSPAPATRHDPDSGPLAVRVRVAGDALDHVEVAVAKGRSGRHFTPLGPVRRRWPDEHVVKWDARDEQNGTWALRIRVVDRDGRREDRYRVVSLERHPPQRLSGTLEPVGGPAVSRRQVVFFAPDPEAPTEAEPAAIDERLALFATRIPGKSPGGPAKAHAGPIPPPAPQRVLGLAPGSQPRELAIDRGIVVWRDVASPEARIVACRLRGARGCVPIPLPPAPGFFSSPRVAAGWIVWQRDDPPLRVIEGCRIDVRSDRCAVIPLVADDPGTAWRLRSFDGRSLLLQGAGRTALCRLRRDGSPCQPRDVVVAPGRPPITEPVHAGRLLGFSEITLETRPAIGCLPEELFPGCLPALAVVVRYHACRLDAALDCDPVPISEAARVEELGPLRVSAGRFAWTRASAIEPAVIRTCVFDPSTGTCPIERPLAGLAEHAGLELDRGRLVWLEARDSAPAVHTHRLPATRTPRPRKPPSIGSPRDRNPVLRPGMRPAPPALRPASEAGPSLPGRRPAD